MNKPYSEWSEEAKEKHRIQTRLWKKRNPDKNKDQKRRWWKKHSQSHKQRLKELRQQVREIALRTFGTICCLCGLECGEKIELHEIHGKRHPRNVEYYVEHKDDFAPTCYQCHRMVHRLMKTFGLSWNDILALKSGNRGRD